MRQPGFLHHSKIDRLRDKIFSKPDITGGVYIDANAPTMECRAEKVDAMPASGWLIYHALLNTMHAIVSGGERSSPADAFAAIGIASEAFVRDALTLIEAIGAGMAKTTVIHIPAMQTCAPG